MRWLALLVCAAAAVGCGSDPGTVADAGTVDPDAAVDRSDEIYDPDRLLRVEIEMAPADWAALRFEHHDFLAAMGPGCQDSPPPKPYNTYPATVIIDGETVANVGVRKKGFLGSVTPVRPSLKLDFAEYDAAQRFAGLRRLTLNNNHQDQSHVNACLAYGVFRAAGVPAPRCNFARVSVNGVELGVYSNVEGIKKPMVARWFADDGGNLYEGVLSDFRDGWTETFELKTNELTPDRSDLSTVAPALAQPDDQVLDALDQVLDVEAMLTFWAVESLVNHWDGYAGNTNNFYVYHDPTTDKLYFLPWGVDAAFGVPNPFPPLDRPASVHALGAVARRLYNLPAAQSRYRARMQQLLDEVWDESALLAEVERMESLIGDYVGVSPQRFAADLSRVRSFINGRRAEVQADLDGEPPAWDHALRGMPCLAKTGEASGTFTATWNDPFPPAIPLGVGAGTMSATYAGESFVLNSAGFSAGPSDISGDRQGIMAIGMRSDTGAGFGLYFGIEPELYTAATLPVDMYTSFTVAMHGPLGRDIPMAGFVFGTLTLDQAGDGPGEPVSGSFAVEIWGETLP